MDNLLSHYSVIGIERGRQGSDRRISADGLLAIELMRILAIELGVSLRHSADLVRRAMAARTGQHATIVLDSGLTLVFSLTVIERRLHDRMIAAVEVAPLMRRGRPSRAPER